MDKIPFLTFGNPGQSLVFLHANGYPPGCYQGLMTKLAGRYHVSAMLQRPLWDGSQPDEIKDWSPFADDLLRFLDEHPSEPPIVIGHSMGGVTTLRAALRQPERFKALILLDPVLFPPQAILQWKLLRMLGLGQLFLAPLIQVAKKRRRTFDNLVKVFTGYRRRKVFRYFSDEALRDYIAGITKPATGGSYELAYTPEWEIQIYLTSLWADMELWKGLRSFNKPLLIIRGAETDTFFAATGQRVIQTNPAAQVETIQKATHLVPLERPLETFDIIQTFLAGKATSPIIRSTLANNGFHEENP